MENQSWYEFLPEGTRAIVEVFEEEFVQDQLKVMFRGMVTSIYESGKIKQKKMDDRVKHINR